jgi:hypothetical protein
MSRSVGHISIKFHTAGPCSSVRPVLSCSEVTNRENAAELLAVLEFPNLLWSF